MNHIKNIESNVNSAVKKNSKIFIPSEDPWWQTTHAKYGFANSRVRSRVEKLIGSNIVRATDYVYMQELQKRLREDHEETVDKGIHNIELQEVEREKRLILDGKMSLEDAPAELSRHPVFRVTQQVRKILDERKYKAESSKIKRKIKDFDYDLLEDLDTRMDSKSEINVPPGMDKNLSNLQEIYYDLEDQVITEADYNRIKYEDPLVKQLKSLETVDEMYALADTIVGHVTSSCVPKDRIL
uniref:Uncharacterized protein n=3 Tax=Clastoptera arizonana TaxID=38151 RepID=A0A1B6DSZ3_9HEMI